MNRRSDIIPIGPRVPRKGGRIRKGIFSGFLRIMGWRITGSIPDEPKMVLIGGPHTSNWDFVFGVFSLFALGLDVHWIGKHTIFRWPFGALLRSFGGIPVNRSSPGALLRDVLTGFRDNETFIFGLSPEGTRSKVTEWKQGFHRIAKSAGVPILPACLDYSKKTIHFGPLHYPTDNFKEDAAVLKQYYGTFEAKYPHLY